LAAIDHSLAVLTRASGEANAHLAIAQRESDAVPVRQWKDSPQRAQALYDQAAARERRMTALARESLLSQQDLEDARTALRLAADDLVNARHVAHASQKLVEAQAQQARAQADLAIAELRRQWIDREGERAQARLRLQQADAALRETTARLADSTLRAVREGVVADVSVRAGDRVLSGATLMKIATLDPMVVDVDVPPLVVNRLKRGAAV